MPDTVKMLSYFHYLEPWCFFKKRLTNWFIANDIEQTEETATKRRAILLCAFSNSAYQYTTTLAFPKDLQNLSYEEIIKILDNHFTPRQTGFSDRHKFYSATQLPGETCHQWADRLRDLMFICGFSDVEEALRDRFVMGSTPGPVREMLYEQDLDQLPLSVMIDMAERVRCAHEASAGPGTKAKYWINKARIRAGIANNGETNPAVEPKPDLTSYKFAFDFGATTTPVVPNIFNTISRGTRATATPSVTPKLEFNTNEVTFPASTPAVEPFNTGFGALTDPGVAPKFDVTSGFGDNTTLDSEPKFEVNNNGYRLLLPAATTSAMTPMFNNTNEHGASAMPVMPTFNTILDNSQRPNGTVYVNNSPSEDEESTPADDEASPVDREVTTVKVIPVVKEASMIYDYFKCINILKVQSKENIEIS